MKKETHAWCTDKIGVIIGPHVNGPESVAQKWVVARGNNKENRHRARIWWVSFEERHPKQDSKGYCTCTLYSVHTI